MSFIYLFVSLFSVDSIKLFTCSLFLLLLCICCVELSHPLSLLSLNLTLSTDESFFGTKIWFNFFPTFSPWSSWEAAAAHLCRICARRKFLLYIITFPVSMCTMKSTSLSIVSFVRFYLFLSCRCCSVPLKSIIISITWQYIVLIVSLYIVELR